MKIVITGASSFIGQRLAQKAIAYGWETLLVLRPGRESVFHGNKQNILPLTMEEYDQLGKLAGACDCLVNLAWNGTRGADRMDKELQQRNLTCSLAAVRSMLAAGCRQVVTAGSQAEYGPHVGIMTEQTECVPNTEYGKAKLAFYLETSLLCVRAGAKYVEPRFFSLYGPNDYTGTMIISILRDMLLNRPCRLTQGIQMWDFLYIDDAIDALVGLCSKACPDGVYNFGSGDTRQLRSYVEEMADITGTKSELLFGAVPYPETGMVSLWPDISKLKQELGYEPKTKFAEGIHSVLRALKVE